MSERTEGLRGSFKLIRLSGIGVFVHWSFFLLLLYFVYSDFSNGATTSQALRTLVFVLAVFACVVLHELGHALMARKFGIKTKDINLLPIGGVARLERMPREPKQEFLIALAGPAVNVLIAGTLALIMLLFNVPFSFSTSGEVKGLYDGSFIFNLLLVNLILVAFNFIPAFPMDGGRVLRSALASKLPYEKATNIAAIVGKILAVGFVIFAIYNDQLMLILIGVFIFFGADSEQKASRFSAKALGNLPGLGPLLSLEFLVFSQNETLDEVIKASEISKIEAFLVTDQDNRLIGLINLDEKAGDDLLLNSSLEVNLIDYPGLIKIYEPLDLLDSPEKAAFVMNYYNLDFIPVSSKGKILGILNLRDLESQNPDGT